MGEMERPHEPYSSRARSWRKIWAPIPEDGDIGMRDLPGETQMKDVEEASTQRTGDILDGSQPIKQEEGE